MKWIMITLVSLLSVNAVNAQIPTGTEWDEMARTDYKLLPKYGHIEKNANQKKSDEKYINEVMQLDQFKGDKTAASNHMIGLGFNYYYRGDLKTAMYRFNQAYLLDSLNTDIYWGYGAIYMVLGEYEKAKEQYGEGLKQNPRNSRLLTDLATYFMAQYYGLEPLDKKMANVHLDSAISYLHQSYAIDQENQNTVYKLSICYWNKNDCDNAWKFYDACKALGGRPITEEFTADLMMRCKR